MFLKETLLELDACWANCETKADRMLLLPKGHRFNSSNFCNILSNVVLMQMVSEVRHLLPLACDYH